MKHSSLKMDLVEVVCVSALVIRYRKAKRKRRRDFWVHPITSQRLLKGQFVKLYSDLRSYPNKFFSYFRMSIESFDELLQIVAPSLTFSDTNMRRSISAVERLTLTLRYLATGNSFHSLYYEFLIGVSTLRNIVRHTCDRLWKILNPLYMPAFDEEFWLEKAAEFESRTNFPNCLGAIDGKHIRVKKPDNSHSLYYNYKNYFSMVLMAVVDADYCFIAVDVGSYGGINDSYCFRRSNFGRRLELGQLNLPPRKMLPNDEKKDPMPFVFVADEAFRLSEHVLRPHARKNLTYARKIFNYRLTRARRMVECAFGILANKWRIFHRPLDVNDEFCNSIIKAACILHNFVRKKDGTPFEDTLYECPMINLPRNRRRAITAAATIRTYFTNYFISAEGSIPWQYEKVL